MAELHADKLKNDPKVIQAKQLLLQAVEEQQAQINGVRAPREELKQSYEKALEEIAQNRGGKLFFPYLGSGMGKGPLVELADGSIKYDMICGIGPHYWGHSHPDIISAEIDACTSDLVMQGHLQQNRDSAELIALLTQSSGMDHCFLSTTGVMANENALKIAFQKKTPAHRLLAFEKCFAGRTLAVSQITDKPGYRQGIPENTPVDYIPFYDEQDPEGSTQRSLEALHAHLKRHPGMHAAMMFELVQGEGGFYPGTRDYFIALMDVLKEHDITIIDDEVQAFGRTPSLFAFQHFGLEEYVDIVTIGKLSQVCATLYNSSFKPKPGLLSQTFLASTSAIRASKVIIESLLKGDYLGEEGQIQKMHNFITSKLQGIADRHPDLLCGPFGIGTMIAFTPLDGSLEKSMQVLRALYDAGVIAFTCGGNPFRIRFLVPIGAVTQQHIEEVCTLLEGVLLDCQANCTALA